MMERLLAETRRLGDGDTVLLISVVTSTRTRREWNDGRDSTAVPIWAGEEVIASLNLTWMHKVATVPQMVKAIFRNSRPLSGRPQCGQLPRSELE